MRCERHRIGAVNSLSRGLLCVMLVLAVNRDASALISVEKVSPERAAELGIQVRARPSGPNAAWIELELRPEGPLKLFQHVNMEIRDDDQLLVGWCPLKSQPTSEGTVKVVFMVDRVFLDKVTLRVLEGQVMNIVGHDLALSEFVNLDELDQPPKP